MNMPPENRWHIHFYPVHYIDKRINELLFWKPDTTDILQYLIFYL